MKIFWFTNSAIGCGKKVLVVGDSTMKSFVEFYGNMLRVLVKCIAW